MRPAMLLACDVARTRVLIDLRATGPLAVLGHDPTLSARPEGFTVDLTSEGREGAGAGGALEGSVRVSFAATAIETPAGISASDRAKMRENMLSRDVLDAARHPAIVLEGRFAGTLEGGTLEGDLVVRGAPRPVSMPVKITRDGAQFAVSGRWEGRLTDLGVKPFKALLGALKLEDWIVLRVEAMFGSRKD